MPTRRQFGAPGLANVETVPMGDAPAEEERVEEPEADEPTQEMDQRDPLAGTRYKTIRVLGRGGYAQVFKAEHRDLGRVFAVKVLPRELSRDSREVERLRREARTAGQIQHPGIVEVTDFGETRDGRSFIVMEYLEGEDLADLLQRERYLDQGRALAIALQVAEALRAAHAHDVIHRDIKPANIILVDDGGEDRVKLVDFGIALSQEHAGSRLTEEGYMPGTPTYMAPEQVRVRAASVFSDMYSLATVMYEMLTGTPPFLEATGIETMARKLREPPQPMRRRAPKARISSKVDRLVMKALDPEPENRFESMLEMTEEIRDALDVVGGTQIDLAPLGARRARATRWALGLGIAGAFAASAVAVVFLGFPSGGGETGPVGGGASGGAATTGSPGAAGVGAVAARGDGGAADGSSTSASVLSPMRAPLDLYHGESHGDDGGPGDAGASTTEAGAPSSDVTRPPRRRGNGEASQPRRTKRETARQLIADGRSHLRNRRLGEAQRAFSEAARLDPGNAAVAGGLGRVAFEQGRYSAAATQLERALRRRPGDNGLRIVLGSAYLRLGQRSRAVEQWEQVLRNDPDNQAATRLLDAVR